MKKIVSILSALILLISLLSVSVNAAGSGALGLSGAEGKQGDTVTVNVNLNSNPGLITMKFTISWDSDLSLTSVSNAGLLAGWTTPAPDISSPYTIRWADSLSTTDSTATGKIATLTFKINDNASIGNKTVTLTFSESRDANGEKNSFSGATATVKVNCKTHSFGSYSTTGASQHKRICATCNYEEVSNHSWNGGVVTKEASCKEAGVKTYTCTDCGATKTEPISTTSAHKYGNWEVTKQPTCTGTGTQQRTCSVCGHVETTTVPAAGHTFGSWSVTKKPTCTEAGTESRKCSKCSATEERAVNALGHSFSKSTVTKQPTCTDPGEETGNCTRCGQKTSQLIKPTGHKYGEWKQQKLATCTEAGSKERSCTTCGKVEEQTVPALGHDFDNPTTVKDPTISSGGVLEGKCKRCGQTTQQKIPCKATDAMSGIVFECEEGVFNYGTEMVVEQFTDDDARVISVKNALGDMAKEFTAFDIKAMLNGQSVQPNGKVTITIPVPKKYEKFVTVYYIGDDGKAVKQEAKINDDKTVSAEVSRLGVYAVCRPDGKSDGQSELTNETPSANRSSYTKTSFPKLIIALIFVAELVIVGIVALILVKRKKNKAE